MCETCANRFYKWRSQVKTGRGRFCSKPCQAAAVHKWAVGFKPRSGEANPRWKGIRRPRPCPVCGRTFATPARTCSRPCGDKLRGQAIRGVNNPFRRVHPPRIKTCRRCHKDYTREGPNKGAGRFYCSARCSRTSARISVRQYLIADALRDAGFVVEDERTWQWLRNPFTHAKMRVDMLLPGQALAIEYDGEQHFTVRESGKRGRKLLANSQARDAIKEMLLRDHGIRLIRFAGRRIDVAAVVAQIREASGATRTV